MLTQCSAPHTMEIKIALQLTMLDGKLYYSLQMEGGRIRILEKDMEEHIY